MPILMVNLRPDADAEACRIARTRTFTDTRDRSAAAQLEADSPWILSTRRTRLRRALSGGILLVWRVSYEDASGLTIESHIVPVLVSLNGRLGNRASRSVAKAVVSALESFVRPHVDAASTEWRFAAERTVRAVATVRAARAQAAGNAGDPFDRGRYQRGLFDRRADRQHASIIASSVDAELAAADRLAAIDRLVAAQRQPPRLLLALVP